MAENQLKLPFEMNINSIREYVLGLSRPVQLAIIAVLAALVIFIVMMAIYITRPRYEVLFQGMEPQQAKEATETLTEMGVEYHLTDGGATILVPEGQQDKLRLHLSPELYSPGIGFSVFEDDGLLISDHDRRKQWQVVLQDELARTISSIEVVQWTRVHLVMPEEAVFLRDRGVASASIFLQLQPMTILTDEQVRSILALVAGSVENLEPEHVTVIDSVGNIYYDAFVIEEDEELVPLEIQEQLLLKKEFEDDLERRLESLLQDVFGPGKARALVNAQLNFDVQETTSVIYEPDPVPRSEHRIEEREEGFHAAPEVAEPNIPGYIAEVYGGEYAREYFEDTVNYEVSEVRDYIARAPGAVERISATVIVNEDQDTAPGIADDISLLVAAAVGYNAERGDMVAVQAVPFDTSMMDYFDEMQEAERQQQLIMYGIIVGIILLIILSVVIYLISRKLAARRKEREEAEAEAAAMAALEEEESFVEEYDLAELLKRDDSQEIEESLRDKVRELAETDPENVAYLMRTWLSED